jgi:hypothetical protein
MRSGALVLFAIASMTISPAAVGMAQTPIADAPFRFDLAQAAGPRGLAVEGFVHNGLPWRITNVRLRVDSVDGDGMVIASTSGWVIGDVEAGGRGYFWVPVSSPARAYRATVQSFDKVAVEAPRVEAP